jgi:hypothetical protein
MASNDSYFNFLDDWGFSNQTKKLIMLEYWSGAFGGVNAFKSEKHVATKFLMARLLK